MGEPSASGRVVKMRSTTGAYVDAPESEIAAREARGYTLPDDAEVQAHKDEVEQGGPAGMATTAAVGAMRAFGGDYWIPKAVEAFGGEGDEELAKGIIPALGERNPGANLAGELGGGLLQGALTGGAGLEAGAAGLAGRMGAGAGVARFAAGGLRAAYEGGLYGGAAAFGQASLESKLGDPALVAERVAGGLGMGALFGAGTHVALSGLGYGLGKMRGKGALGKTPTVGDADALLGKVEPGVAKGSELRRIITGADGQLTSEAAPAIHGQAAKTIDALKPRLTTLVTDDMRDVAHLSAMYQGSKPGAISNLVKRDADALLPQATQGWSAVDEVEAAFGRIDEMNAAGESIPFSKPARELRKRLELYRSEISEAARAKDSGAIHTAVDKLKRQVANSVKQGMLDSSQSTGAGKFAREFEGLHESIRTGLEDVGTWGEAGAFQRDLNAAYHDRAGVMGTFNNSLTTKYGHDPSNPWRPGDVADPAKVSPFVDGLSRQENALREQALRDYVRTRGAAAEAALKHGQGNATQRAAFERIVDRTKQFESALVEGHGAAKAIHAAELLEKGEHGAHLARGLLGGGLLAAGAVDDEHRMGFMGLAALAYLGKPYTYAKTLSKIAGIAERASTSESRAIAGVGKRALSGLERVSQTVRELRAKSLAAEPAAIARRAADALDGAAPAAPQITGAAKLVAERAAGVLLRHSPFRANANPLSPQPTPSKTERREFRATADALEDPTQAFDDIASGKLSLGQARAVRDAYPARWDDFRGKMIEQLTTDAAAGKLLPYRDRLRMGLLLDLPLDPSLEPSAMRHAQESYGPPPPPAASMGPSKPPPASRMPRRAQAARTGSERSEADSELD